MIQPYQRAPSTQPPSLPFLAAGNSTTGHRVFMGSSELRQAVARLAQHRSPGPRGLPGQRHVCASAGAGSSGGDGGGRAVPVGAAAHRVASLFARAPALSLERAVGDKHGIDQNLWDSCHFRAEVYPDLPLATTWRDLLRRTVQTASHASEEGRVDAPPKACPTERWTVHTVAAQLRSRDQLRSMMLSAAGVDPAGDPKPGARPADALLFVSGSHPARRLPGAGRYAHACMRPACSLERASPPSPTAHMPPCARLIAESQCASPSLCCSTPRHAMHCRCRWLQDSFDLLLLASAMREEGYLPASVSLWAVENPMLAPVERLRQKVDAGAEVVVTQPPLLLDRVQRWAEEADRQLLSRHVKVCTCPPQRRLWWCAACVLAAMA